MKFNLSTCGDAAAEEAHLVERGLGVDLDGAGGVKHGVLGEGGGVEEVVHRLPQPRVAVHQGEPRAIVKDHGGLERIYTVGSTEVCLVRLAIHAFFALPGEDGNYVVSRGQTVYSFAHTLHHSDIIYIDTYVNK
jgi:hypothetical protein